MSNIREQASMLASAFFQWVSNIHNVPAMDIIMG